MEELLQPAMISAGGETRADEETGATASQSVAAHVQSDADNRRSQQRYSCRLGSQVYRTGISVPHHCCLTDLSSGGCYLEVSLPFPMGTSVEITVRTQDLKVELAGTVQASHPDTVWV